MPRYLFIDRHHVQRIDGVRQVFHRPVKHPTPVLTASEPWEKGRVTLWSAPVWSDDRQRWCAWYFTGDPLRCAYAESPDGLNWEKPMLGLVEHDGSRENNLVDLGFEATGPKESRIVMLRDNRTSDPQQRFKGLTLITGPIHPLVSPDGLTWRKLDAPPIPTDDEYRLGYDAVNHRFIATVKLGGNKAPGFYAVPELGRAVSLAVSDDFAHWSDPELIYWGDDIDQRIGCEMIERALADPDMRSPAIVKPDQFFTDVYSMPVFTYEGMYLGLPVMFHQSGAYWTDSGFSNQDGILYTRLAASRDLHHWDRLSREPFIDRSPLSEEERSDYGAIYPNVPVLHGEELWFYYNGSWTTHVRREAMERAGMVLPSDDRPRRGGVYLAKLRRDGFASMHAGGDGGVLLTRPLRVTGKRLHINVDATGGEVRAELRDAKTGLVIAGHGLGDYVRDRRVRSDDGAADRPRMGTGARFPDDPLKNDTLPTTGDHTDAVMRWTGGDDLGALQDREVRICFYLRRAHLYAFWFGD